MNTHLSQVQLARQTEAFLLLQKIPQLGCVGINKLLQKMPNILDIFEYDYKQLIELGLSINQAQAIVNPNWSYCKQQLLIAQKNNIEIINIYDPDYPKLLKEIYDPPIILYIKGNKKILNTLQMGVVGTRRPTVYGRQMAEHFCSELATYGYVITSGFAMGIDITAHLAAMQHNVATVAVMGTSLDCVYPAKHTRYVAQLIEGGGALISENGFTTKPHPTCFPRRNRIISGLSRGVLVVEAARQSGSLITARCAMDQSKEVFAIPGNINNPHALGCLDLISQGAKLVTRIEDIIEELSGFISVDKSKAGGEKFIKANQGLHSFMPKIDSVQQQLLNAISGGVTDFDAIVTNSKLSSDIIAGQLVQLEILGCIATVPGGYMKITK